ncbi:MAG TPA: alpha/beta hydrolase [Candidatus Deferrimicrobiaceae bacterium]|nr:alpha/beta hydrolase [Candidatus Deferrimicrobiaceae bacterium]
MHRRPRVLLGAVGAGIALGVVISVIVAGGPEAWLAARQAGRQVDVPPYEARGRLVEVDGREIYLDCRGPLTPAPAGQPMVLLEAGFGAGAASWGHVLDGVAEFTRVCAWDRPGLGRSEPRGRHTPAEALDDLWRALAAAGEGAPLVIVAHSFGGVYARILAAEHPDEIGGLLLIDAYYPDIGIEDDPALPVDFRERFRRSLEETAQMLSAGEDLDWTATLEELRAATPFTGPAILLSIEPRLRPFDADPEVNDVIVAAFKASLAAMLPGGRIEVVPKAGHFIQYDQPDLVIARVRGLLELAGAS